MTKVSVIMPVYNCEDFLKDSVESILNQTLDDLELICVDDGSTDDSLEILKEYENRDSRVKVFGLAHSGGGDARNFALKHISGEYLYFIDADDILDLNAFETFYQLSKEKNLDFLIFKAKKYDVDKKVLFETPYYNMDSLSDFRNEVFNFNDLDNLIFKINVTPWCKFYNSNFVLNSKAQFRNASKFHDNQFFWDIIFEAERIYFLDEFFYTQNIHSRSLIESAGKNHCDVVDVHNDVWDLFKKHGQFERFKKHLFEQKIFLLLRRYEEIKAEFKEMFFRKMKNDFKSLKNTEFRDYLAFGRKFIFDAVLISQNHDDFDMLKDFYYILQNSSETMNRIMSQSVEWFETLSKSHKHFAFNYIYEYFKNRSLSAKNREFLKTFDYKVSVIVPVFNVEDYLDDAFSSILNQTIGFENLEIIFIDDASTDSSPQIIKKYCEKYDNVVCVFLDENSGYPGLPRNIGMYYATSPYLMFFDPDDVFLKDGCRILYDEISSNDLDIVCGVHSEGEGVPEWLWLNILTDPTDSWKNRVSKVADMVKGLILNLKSVR